MLEADPYACWSLSDRVQMLDFEAELPHLPRSLIKQSGRPSLRQRPSRFAKISVYRPDQGPGRCQHPFLRRHAELASYLQGDYERFAPVSSPPYLWKADPVDTSWEVGGQA